jgi:3-oxoacyl-[acyl-carrier-protein] synthase II
MSSTPRRAVLTGVGVITPLGRDLGSFWAGLRDGRSGIRPIRSFDASALPVRFGGEVDGFDVKDYLDKKDRKRLSTMSARTIQLAVAAARLALEDARVDVGWLDPARFGVEVGTGTIPGDLADLGPAAQASLAADGAQVDLAKWGTAGLAQIPPMWMLSHVPNMPACHISILHNAQGPNNTITQTDVASLLALGEAYRIIGRDRADFLLTGGSDTRMNPVSLVRQCLFSRLSHRNEAPERACRPFDRDRDGIVLGEGAGVLALEELEHARRRGARIYAEVVGFGAAFDPDGRGRGLARAVRAALAEANIEPGDLDHINAHGASSVEVDIWEARGLRQALGDWPVPVFAPKSYFGHLGAGSGTTELAASVLALAQALLPATLNSKMPDRACPVTVTREPRRVTRPYFLKVGLTEMGQCAAVIGRKWD